ncbi:MAG: glycosyltransferase [Burkholderiales bacterium]|nr:glycosyltransferase [Burkholderiales bacterium]
MIPVVILVGSNSIHTIRYIKAISSYISKIIFITNALDPFNLPSNVEGYVINFRLSNIRAKFQIAKIIMPYAHAIIHIHQANSYAYHTIKAILLTKLSYRVILTTWGSDILVLPYKNLWLKRMVKFNLTHSDIVTSDSLYMSSQIKKLLPKIKQLHTINFGVQNFPPNLDFNAKEKIILSNRLHKANYNIDKIIKAFAKLQIIFPEFKLIIAGTGTDTEKLQILAKTLNLKEEQIVFTGMLNYEELSAWYKKAMLFISIPTSDATSLSLLEAMSYGAYPIVSNLPANLEWIMDKINGTINQNSELLDNDLAMAINLTQQKREDIAKINYSIIQQKAVFNNSIQYFINLYTVRN